MRTPVPPPHVPPRMQKPFVAAQPLWVRISHWCNALAVVIMILSGWRIYNASPIFHAFSFPSSLTLGGWLGGALQWHFAAMWLLLGNALFYTVMTIGTRRVRKRFLPLSIKAVLSDFRLALGGRLTHADLHRYNAVQKLLYLFVMFDVVALIASGLAIWKPVQFSIVCQLLGGYDVARIVHFAAMTSIAGFIVVHVAMVILVPRTLLTMFRGY